MSVQKTVLANGVRVLTETLPHVGSASIGVWCQTGSADELSNEAGITHLIEHMLFKGTPSRTAKQIAEDIEGRGGVLNAFTDKQTTCYYCQVLAEDAKPSLDVLGDMVLNSLIDAEELDREKQVVVEEIRRGEDDPGSQVHEMHLQSRWNDNVLGLPVIGTKESVLSFQRDDLKNYMDRRYKGGNLMIAAAGKVDHDEVASWAHELFSKVEKGGGREPLARPKGQTLHNYHAKEVEQVHFCIGTDSPSPYDEEYFPLMVLDEILGGGMSSRLFQEVRERRGLAYAIGSYALSYSSGGAWTVYGGTSATTWPEVQKVIREEMDKMMDAGPDDEELEKAKRALAGTLILSLEGTGARMRRMARTEMTYGREITAEETVNRIRAVSAEQIKSLANRMFDHALVSTTAIGPAQP